MKHIKSKFVHIVISTREMQDPELLLHWLIKQNAVDYVIAHELGANGHDHIDCFAELSKEQRLNHVKTAICKLYPSIPKDERRNIRVTKNTIDDDPMYGYGYAAKEGRVLYSTLDEFQLADAVDYYKDHLEYVKETQQKHSQRFKDLGISTLEIGKEMLAYVTLFYSDHKYRPEDSISWIIDNYFTEAIKQQRISYPTYMKCNKEKLEEYVRHFLGAVLLTAPKPTPIIYSDHFQKLQCQLSQNENLQ